VFGRPHQCDLESGAWRAWCRDAAEATIELSTGVPPVVARSERSQVKALRKPETAGESLLCIRQGFDFSLS